MSLTSCCILEHSWLSQELARHLSPHLPTLESDPVAATAQAHVAAAAARAVSCSSHPAPAAPLSLALCSRTKENLSRLLHLPGTG